MIPRLFKVGGINYSVEEKELVNVAGDYNHWGVTKHDSLQIEVLQTLPKERKHQVLIHELVHTMFEESGLEQNEDTVNRLGIILHQVLKDNNFEWVKE